MTDAHMRATEAMKREASADGGSLLAVMRGLWPYIWPADRRDLKLRVAAAMVLLLAAKLATIAVPFTFKWATDALAGEGSAPVASSSWLTWTLTAPVLLTIAYGGMRILMAALTQTRDGIFAKVAMNAVRRLAYRTFEHMHQLSLRFHLERKTGGLTRVLERGRNAIETIVRMVIMQLVPTVIERSSWTDDTMPVRMYWIDPDEKLKAVRLVYSMGSNEYWGVQMTDWDDAPVLADRSHTRHIGGRTYDLYYDGPKLHMVVLRTPKASYWVINTLLDRLSNETMIAIAKGLKPLSSVKR